MQWLILIAIAIIYWIFKLFEGIWNWISEISNAHTNSKRNKERQLQLIQTFGERDNSKPITLRNNDIIYHYSSKINWTINSSSTKQTIKDCYKDICIIEWDSNIFDDKIFSRWDPKHDIISRENRTYSGKYIWVYDSIVTVFELRLSTLNRKFSIESEYLPLTISHGFHITEINNQKKIVDDFILQIKNKDKILFDKFESLLNNVNSQSIKPRKYFIWSNKRANDFAEVINKWVISSNNLINVNKQGALQKALDKYKNFFLLQSSRTNKSCFDFKMYVYTESIVDNILKDTDQNYSWLKEDKSEGICDLLIDSLFINNLKNLLYLDIPSWELLFLWDEEKKLNELKKHINDQLSLLLPERELKIKDIKLKIKDCIAIHNNKINFLIDSYERIEKSWIEAWAMRIIYNYHFDNFATKDFDLVYDKESRSLIIEYTFPSFDEIPKLKWHTKTWIEQYYSESAMKKIYDKYILSVCIRILYELYNNDKHNYIEWIVFNGIVNSMDKSNGHNRTDCILSVSTEKKDIKNIVLEYIDPKETIRSLHWICATSLSSLTPVAPISTINKNDKRFVDWYNVIDSIDNSVNLACMDRQDFENLIRDLFEKIYWEKWWEVKITQASRDWWVDAIAFDPDPVTWWKILIQAKRYTNVVWVWAVRDLAWAVHHEWAMKWILVTTSNFWHDALKFVAKEPISLINWQNLLSLLEKYWYHAHINISEARKILKAQEKK